MKEERKNKKRKLMDSLTRKQPAGAAPFSERGRKTLARQIIAISNIYHYRNYPTQLGRETVLLYSNIVTVTLVKPC